MIMQLHASGDEEHGISMQCGRIIQHVHDVCSLPCFQVMYNVRVCHQVRLVVCVTTHIIYV